MAICTGLLCICSKVQHVKWPTPEVFAAFVKWSEVSPHVPKEAAHQNDVEVGVNNEQDEAEYGAKARHIQ
ncbi:hypothetical protein L195_g044252 [Trifolium pratense]|uniref:Uncharacterized protein n=1 Tax=Trifolium pratense TaxID=57577 RepID=A0A2K3MBI8_TRIPR|nr:hypothetical protein L195_g044252 [Trifolium pratense]